MSEIVFHLIDDPAEDAFWYFAAELCAEQAEAQRPTYVVCAGLAHVEGFDDYLWSYRDDRFVPHTADPEDADHAPIFIGCDPEAGGFARVINLTGAPIPRPTDREHIDEVIPADEQSRADARARWRQYKSAGATIDHHRVESVRSRDE
ncbi:DNA polymerase III subunit chi [Guyparkeria halopsychrophila]|uniref:DNA polymerase III subunit chi n=1 Tax=Guyparkeria halopsychrophila TaxID=3139421 RepID=UPI0037C58BE5